VEPGYYIVVDGNPILRFQRFFADEQMKDAAICYANKLAADEDEIMNLVLDRRILAIQACIYVYEHDGTTPVLIHQVETQHEVWYPTEPTLPPSSTG
jgi:hypothetical protein